MLSNVVEGTKNGGSRSNVRCNIARDWLITAHFADPELNFGEAELIRRCQNDRVLTFLANHIDRGNVTKQNAYMYRNISCMLALGTSSTLPYGTDSGGLGAILFGTIFKMAEVNRATRVCSIL